jgi:hypothetical protein
MSTDNSSNFDSWNTKGYNKDTRHAPDGNDSWNDEFDSLDNEFRAHQTLSHLQNMLESRDPKVRELARNIISQKSGSAGALKSHNQQVEESLKNQVGKPRGNNRRGWDNMEITRSVRNLLNGK